MANVIWKLLVPRRPAGDFCCRKTPQKRDMRHFPAAAGRHEALCPLQQLFPGPENIPRAHGEDQVPGPGQAR